MEKCNNCLKKYKSRGINIHKRKCDPIYLLIKKKEEDNKIIISCSNYHISLLNNLPDDCVKIIYEFLLLQDKHTSYFKLYQDINNISFYCKNFYTNKPNMKFIKII
jgi:hypothetical protein